MSTSYNSYYDSLSVFDQLKEDTWQNYKDKLSLLELEQMFTQAVKTKKENELRISDRSGATTD